METDIQVRKRMFQIGRNHPAGAGECNRRGVRILQAAITIDYRDGRAVQDIDGACVQSPVTPQLPADPEFNRPRRRDTANLVLYCLPSTRVSAVVSTTAPFIRPGWDSRI